MSSQIDRLINIIDNSFDYSSTPYHRAVRSLAEIASNPNISQSDLEKIWQGFRWKLPSRSSRPVCSPPIDYNAAAAIKNKEKHLLRTLYYPLVDAIAANPAASADILTEIAYYAPRATCQNPTLPDLLRTQPDWVQTLSGKALGEEGNETIMRLLRCGNAPRLLIEPILRGELPNNVFQGNLFQEEAQWHIAITGESNDTDWIQEVEEYWRSYAQTTSGSEREEYQELAIAGLLPDWAYGEDPSEQIALWKAKKRFRQAIDPELSQEESALLRNDTSVAVQLAATINPVTPEVTRHKAIQEGMGQVVAFHNVAPMAVILRRHHSIQTGESILAACHKVLLHLLITNNTVTRRYHLLGTFLSIRSHPHLLEDAVRSQEAGEYWPVLLAWTLGIQPDTMRAWGIHERAALEALAQDGNRWVRAAARARLHDPEVRLSW